MKTTKVFTVDDEEFERERDVKPLGSFLTEDMKINWGIVIANQTSYGVKK